MVSERAMGKIKKKYSPQKIAALLLTAMFIIAIIYILAQGLVSWNKGYSWAEMDWNQDGSTSLSEFFASCDIGLRPVTVDDKECVEYFSYKDGAPIKIVCME